MYVCARIMHEIDMWKQKGIKHAKMDKIQLTRVRKFLSFDIQ